MPDSKPLVREAKEIAKEKARERAAEKLRESAAEATRSVFVDSEDEDATSTGRRQ